MFASLEYYKLKVAGSFSFKWRKQAISLIENWPVRLDECNGDFSPIDKLGDLWVTSGWPTIHPQSPTFGNFGRV